jgi:pimeloyl-ACP methyl ester carboxylesterase
MFVSVDGALINTVSFGAGDDVFVAHGGWTGSWEIWQQPFERLSQKRRCVAYDHRGCGATSSDPASIDANRLVDDLFAVMDTLEVKQCTLAAESMGGFIGLLAVERRPERFTGLVLVSSVYEVTPDATAGLVAGSRADYVRTIAEFVEACVPEPDSEHLKRWGRDILGRAEPEAAARLLEGCYGESADLSKIAVPTLIIHGTKDTIVSPDIATHLATEIADAELHLLDGAGHVPTVTRPDQVVEIIDDWLRRRIV